MYGAGCKLQKYVKDKTHDLNHDLTFSAHTIYCVCPSMRPMFRVLGIYNFGQPMDLIQILVIIVSRSFLLNCNDVLQSIKWKCAVCGFRSMDGLELTKSIKREIWDAFFVLNACTMNGGSNFWGSIIYFILLHFYIFYGHTLYNSCK
jgi:hypothetical protein